MSANSPLSAYMSRQQAMSTQAQRGQGFNNLLLQAGNMRQASIGSALNYSPLQTGSTNTQTRSGLGTWLPQLAGAAIGAGMGAMTGGASSMANMGGNMGGNFSPSSYFSNGPSYANPSAPNMSFGNFGNPSYNGMSMLY